MLFGKWRQLQGDQKYTKNNIGRITSLLPECLKHITITGCDIDNYPFLKIWTEGDLPPNLESIDLVYSHAGWAEITKVITNLGLGMSKLTEPTYTANGVKLSIRGPLMECCEEAEQWKNRIGMKRGF